MHLKRANLIGYPGANAPYAAYVEFGTGGLNVPTELKKDIAIT